ncbi:MAG: alpha/beta fold hydrolase [Desulfomonilaceae bacterium]
MPYCQQDKLNIYYEIHGQGSPLVMIRGLGSNADHWYAQTEFFAKFFKVLIFDNRGIARSSDPGEDYTVPAMAADTVGLMDALKLKMAYVMGLSMGGMIAQELAINYPDRIKGLVLVCTHCGGSRQTQPSAEVSALFKEMVYENSPEAKVNAATTLFHLHTLKNFPEIPKYYSDVSLKNPASTEILIKQWGAVLQHDTYSRLPRIGAPTLVLSGDGDVLIPPENSKILAERIPNAELEIVPNAGHQVLIEQAALCNEAILNFLRRCENQWSARKPSS